MPKRSGRPPTQPKRPRDANELGALIVRLATDDELEPEADPAAIDLVPVQPEPRPDDGKDPAAVALGRKGGKKGGKSRMASLTPEERSALGKAAAAARWGKDRKQP